MYLVDLADLLSLSLLGIEAVGLTQRGDSKEK